MWSVSTQLAFGLSSKSKSSPPPEFWGKGKEFDIERSVGIYHRLKDKINGTKVGFAGGFTSEDVIPQVNELKEKIGNDFFCIDAEAGLRDKLSDRNGDDVLNLDKVKKYIENSAKVFDVRA